MAIQFAASPKPVVHSVSNNSVTVTNTVSDNKSGAARVAKWRAAHGDEYRAYMREYMKKKRAA